MQDCLNMTAERFWALKPGFQAAKRFSSLSRADPKRSERRADLRLLPSSSAFSLFSRSLFLCTQALFFDFALACVKARKQAHAGVHLCKPYARSGTTKLRPRYRGLAAH